MEKKNSLKKTLGNLLFFLILIALTFGLLFKDQSITDVLALLNNVQVKYIIVAVICMMIYMSLEALNLGRTLKNFGEKSTFLKNVKYSLIGFFFSAITPAASGGQPMQIYYMHKDKISVANSTLALFINLTCMQITTIGFAFISLLFNYQYMNWGLIVFFIIGISLNSAALALLLISIFSKRLLNGLIKMFIGILKFFRVKNIEGKQKRIEEEVAKYQESAVMLKGNKALLVKALFTSFVQFFVYYSVSYWVYRSFGFAEKNIVEVTSMQALLYATVSGIPSPGAVGVSEGVFMQLFGNIYPEYMVRSATLLNRGVNFYLLVIISEIVIIINNMFISKREKLHKVENEDVVETEKEI